MTRPNSTQTITSGAESGEVEGGYSMDVIDVPVIRKPIPRAREPFRCVIDDDVAQDDPWARPQEESHPPICTRCERWWGTRFKRRPGMTHGDARAFQRLAAMVARLEWEIYNGHHR